MARVTRRWPLPLSRLLMSAAPAGTCRGEAGDRGQPDRRLGAGIQRQSTTEQAADAIRQAVLSGRLLPGTPLREAALAAELGVSRSTVREAARTLEGEGLVCYARSAGVPQLSRGRPGQ
jgi:DNA-binding transcriptional ArsR family regulator